MADITSFLVQLAQDSELQERFKSDPQGTMAAEGLSQDHLLHRGEMTLPRPGL